MTATTTTTYDANETWREVATGDGTVEYQFSVSVDCLVNYGSASAPTSSLNGHPHRADVPWAVVPASGKKVWIKPRDPEFLDQFRITVTTDAM